MTHEEKINYMRIAVGVAGFSIREKDMDLLVSIYELINVRGEKGNIKDILEVERQVKQRADIKAKSELLDKISDKV